MQDRVAAGVVTDLQTHAGMAGHLFQHIVKARVKSGRRLQHPQRPQGLADQPPHKPAPPTQVVRKAPSIWQTQATVCIDGQ